LKRKETNAQMTKQELITTIKKAFQSVTLEDGIGLWEAQGIDDYADSKTLEELRKKDERTNWNTIPYKDLVECQSSLSFFDAKGMRFCLPQFLIFHLLADEIYEEQGINAPDVLFTLSHKLNEAYQQSRFSLFNKEQIESIICFLEYKLDELSLIGKNSSSDNTAMASEYFEQERNSIHSALTSWKQKLTPILLERVTSNDLDQLQKISHQTFYETFSASNTSENMGKYLNEEFTLEKLGTELSNIQSEFYFAKDNDHVIGYLKLNTGASQTEKQSGNAVEIERIYVLKEYHGKNIGQILCDKAIERAKQNKADYLWLGVWEENPRAIKFYQKNGFVEYDKHIFKLGDDEQTDILMRLKLNHSF
jgi:ribosomal protein S18 acetylase RimI-like enzyme